MLTKWSSASASRRSSAPEATEADGIQHRAGICCCRRRARGRSRRAASSTRSSARGRRRPRSRAAAHRPRVARVVGEHQDPRHLIADPRRRGRATSPHRAARGGAAWRRAVHARQSDGQRHADHEHQPAPRCDPRAPTARGPPQTNERREQPQTPRPTPISTGSGAEPHDRHPRAPPSAAMTLFSGNPREVRHVEDDRHQPRRRRGRAGPRAMTDGTRRRGPERRRRGDQREPLSRHAAQGYQRQRRREAERETRGWRPPGTWWRRRRRRRRSRGRDRPWLGLLRVGDRPEVGGLHVRPRGSRARR